MDRPGSALRLEGAIKNGEVLFLEPRRSFDRLVLVHELHDPIHRILPVAETTQRLGHRVVHDLEHPASRELLVLHEGDVGLDAGRVAIHHEGDRAGGRDHRDLRVPVAGLGAERRALLPGCPHRIHQVAGQGARVDSIHVRAMLGDDAQHRLAVLRETGKGPRHGGDACAGRVRVPVHEGAQSRRDPTPLVTVVGDSPRHEERAQVRVAQTERPVVMAVPLDRRRGIGRVIDDDFLGQDHGLDAVLVSVGVEALVRAQEFHEVQGGEIARGVVQVHVFRAWVRSVDTSAVWNCMPIVDRGVELDAGVAALVRRLGDHAHEVARPVGVDDLAIRDRLGRPGGVFFERVHELVGHADGVVGVLEEDRGVGGTVERGIVARVDQRPGFLLLLGLALDVFHDVRVIDVQDHHLRGPARAASGLDDAGERVEPLHEGNRPRGRAASLDVLL